MQIGNLTKCAKPRRFNNFMGSECPDNPKCKKRYKHYEQMSDEVLCLHSMLKAHNEVKDSAKMRLYKAVPAITTAIVGTGLALTHPGKLATKAAAGLGFLALYKASDVVCDNFCSSKEEDAKPSFAKTLFACAAVMTSAVGLGFLLNKAGDATKVGQFVKKELNTLSKEINETKAGKFIEKTFEPFYKKHALGLNAASLIGGLGAIIGGCSAQAKLSDSIQKDFINQTRENFIKGKMAQCAAREHFDSIDAIEV